MAATSIGDVKLPSDRSFGLTFAAFFVVVTIVKWWRHGALATVPLALAGVMLAVSLTRPRVLRPLNVVWLRFGLLLNRVTSPIVFGLIYVLAVVPTGLALRLRRQPLVPLHCQRQPAASSYWVARPAAPVDPARMRDQF